MENNRKTFAVVFFYSAKKVVFAIGAHIEWMFIFYAVYTKPWFSSPERKFSCEFVASQNTFGVTIYPLVLRESSDLVILLASLEYPPSLLTFCSQIDTQEGKQECLWEK